jgi:hypothetical protein
VLPALNKLPALKVPACGSDAAPRDRQNPLFLFLKTELREDNTLLESIFTEIHSKIKDISNYITTNSMANIAEYHNEMRNSMDSTSSSYEPGKHDDYAYLTIDETTEPLVIITEPDQCLVKID